MWSWCKVEVSLVDGMLAGAIGKVWRQCAVWLCPYGQHLGRQNCFSGSYKNGSFGVNDVVGSRMVPKMLARC